jgi:hypothetical protein
MAGRRLALIVATDEYQDPGLRRLRAPAQDAEALAGVLADPELGAFEVDVLRNGTSSTIGERVETLLSGGKADDLIVLHFSCHGLKDDTGELYLAATNTRPALLASTAVDSALVNRLMRRSRAQRVVLFLDCCYGGAFERGMVPRAGGVVDVADQFSPREEELGGGRGRVVITASNAMEFAFEGTDLADSIATQPSIFTGALVEGLTSGEADRDQDGMVSLGELYDYVFERVRKESPNQTPGKWEFGLQGELILAKNPQRVVVPAPVPADLLALIDHPFPATRLGSVDVLARLAEGMNLPVAAGARDVLERMVNDDSRAVARAAAEAVRRASIRVSADSVDIGTVRVGTEAAAEVSIEGVPLAAASRVEASIPALRARRVDRTIRIEADTSVPGQIDGIVTITGPAGIAEVHVVGMIEPIAARGGAQENVSAAKVGIPDARPREADSVGRERLAVSEVEQVDPKYGRSEIDGTATQDGLAALDVTTKGEALAADVVMPREGANGSQLAKRRTATANEVIEDVTAPDQLTADETRGATSAGGSWSLGRSATRGLLGAVFGDLIASLGVYLLHVTELSGHLDLYLPFITQNLVIDAVAFAATVAFAERLLPAIRVPDGEAYRSWRQHRLRSAALQGAVVGGTVGVIDFLVLATNTGATWSLDILFWFPSSAAIGFALAEALLRRREKAT